MKNGKDRGTLPFYIMAGYRWQEPRKEERSSRTVFVFMGME
ncbi:MAG: hypothetical protein SXA11_08255 [Cyanobacteriota bacterium]|nr:hypothetical protein [Cyanobacteriota bacterium]